MTEKPSSLSVTVPDVVKAFENMLFLDGLKESKRLEFSQLAARLRDSADRVKQLLVHANPAFSAVDAKDLRPALVDSSLVNRTEFFVEAPANRLLAYVGDAYLTLHVAKRCFCLRHTPHDYQLERNHQTNEKRLARVYQQLFGVEALVVTFNDVPGVRQKAEFIEALIAALELSVDRELAEWLCERVANNDDDDQ